MIDAQNIIDEFRNVGAQLKPNSGRLNIFAPRGRITPKMLERAQRFKAEILKILQKPRLRVWRAVVETDGRVSGLIYIDPKAENKDKVLDDLCRRFGRDRVKLLELKTEVFDEHPTHP